MNGRAAACRIPRRQEAIETGEHSRRSWRDTGGAGARKLIVRLGAWTAGPISGWERPQWCRKAASPGPRGDDAVAPEFRRFPQITIGGLKSTL